MDGMLRGTRGMPSIDFLRFDLYNDPILGPVVQVLGFLEPEDDAPVGDGPAQVAGP